MEFPGGCKCEHCPCPGVSAVLDRWNGDRDFSSAADRDVTAMPGWRPVLDPDVWCKDPGEATLLWRIVMNDTDQVWSWGAIRSGTMYRYYGAAANHPEDSRLLGFRDTDWTFFGSHGQVGLLPPAAYDWRLALGSVELRKHDLATNPQRRFQRHAGRTSRQGRVFRCGAGRRVPAGGRLVRRRGSSRRPARDALSDSLGSAGRRSSRAACRSAD